CDSDQRFGFVVVWSDIFVRYRPVCAQTVTVIRFEVIIRKTKRHPSIVVGSTSEDAGAEPAEFAPFRHRVRFSFELPSAIGGCEVAERFPTSEVGGSSLLGTTMIDLVRPLMFLKLLSWVQHGSGLQHGDSDTQSRQNMGDRPTARTRADDDDIMNFGAAFNL